MPRGAQATQRIAFPVDVDRPPGRGQRRDDHIAAPGGDVPRVGGHRHVDGTRAFGGRGAQRLADHRVRRGRIQAQHRLRDRREHPAVIDDLVGEELLAGTLDLAGDGQHRHAVQGRRGHAVQHGGRAGAEGGQAHPRKARRHGRALGHERGGRFPDRRHHLDAVLARGLHEVDDGLARVAEDVPHAGRANVAGQQCRGGPWCHRSSFPRREPGRVPPPVRHKWSSFTSSAG